MLSSRQARKGWSREPALSEVEVSKHENRFSTKARRFSLFVAPQLYVMQVIMSDSL